MNETEVGGGTIGPEETEAVPAALRLVNDSISRSGGATELVAAWRDVAAQADRLQAVKTTRRMRPGDVRIRR